MSDLAAGGGVALTILILVLIIGAVHEVTAARESPWAMTGMGEKGTNGEKPYAPPPHPHHHHHGHCAQHLGRDKALKHLLMIPFMQEEA